MLADGEINGVGQIPAVPQLCGSGTFGIVQEHAGIWKVSGKGSDLKPV